MSADFDVVIVSTTPVISFSGFSIVGGRLLGVSEDEGEMQEGKAEPGVFSVFWVL